MLLAFFLSLGLAGDLYAQVPGDFISAEEGQQVSQEYVNGPILIYDCERLFWACVDKESAKSCEKESCVKSQEFKKFQECVEEQKRHIHRGLEKGICLKKRPQAPSP